MCRPSKDMEKNGDHIASTNNGNVPANPVIKVKNADREMINSNKNRIEEEDALPAELQHALHLSSTSGFDHVDSAPQKARSNNASAPSEGSLTSASPQSTVEHAHTPHMHAHAHNHQANHLHLNTSLQCDNHEHHYNQDHNPMANHNQNHLNLDHDNGDDNLDSSGCNSTHMFNSMILNNDTVTDDCECAAAPFFLPKNAWMAASSGSSLEEPTFFSSSIVNGSLSTPHDLSLMSSSMSRSLTTLHTQENAHQRTTHTFLNNNMHFMEAGGNFHQIPADHNASMMMMSNPEYGHYANVPSFSSFLAAYPPCSQSEKANHHVDFFSVGDGDGVAAEAECSMYQSQMYMGDDDDSVAYMQYQNAGQEHSWHCNAMQQESNEGAYTCYWASMPQGTVPVIPSTSGGMGAHVSSYAFNAMELQQQAEHSYNAHQQGGHHGTPMLTHSQSVPLYLEHFGSTHHSMQSMGDQRIQIAGGASESYVSSLSKLRGGGSMVPSQLRKTRELRSCSNAVELEDQGPHAEHSWVDGNGAAQWRSGPYCMIKGAARHSTKRSTPDGEDEDSVHESAPPLKRSASWDSVGLQYNNKQSSSALNEHRMPMPKGSPMSACKSTSPKQDKPRARQGIANDPQSIAARHRRERISERLKILQQLVPNGSKVDLVTMLEKAINYVKFLQLQVKVLATDEYWPTPLNKFPKVAAMAQLAADSKEPPNLEKVEKALAETIQAIS